MGTIYRPSYTIPLPEGAKVIGKKAVWVSKGGTKSGTLSGANRVLVLSDIWTAQYVDENGATKKVSTKCKDKAAANRVLVRLENEVAQVRAGALSREDIDCSKTRQDPLETHLENFYVYQRAKGVDDRQIKDDHRMLPTIFREMDIDSLTGVNRARLDKWIVHCLDINRSARTINSYIDRLRTFSRWCVDNRRLQSDPTAKIKDQNEAVDRRRERRSLTTDEITRLLHATRTRRRDKRCNTGGEETELIYRVALGTGLRSTEMAVLQIHQIDVKRCRIALKARGTKNKKDIFQPITQGLSERLAAWIVGKCPSEVVFHHDKDSLGRSFEFDCQAAGIERVGPDGRSVDVHSLRRTFGTMLARAGVPLTTTQRLMRHSTPELPAKLYIDVEPIDMMQAIDKLPSF